MENIRINLEVEHSINQEVLFGQSENILPLLVTGDILLDFLSFTCIRELIVCVKTKIQL